MLVFEDGASEPCIRRGKLPHVMQTLDRFEYRDFVKKMKIFGCKHEVSGQFQ
jgi:hypothetical protein